MMYRYLEELREQYQNPLDEERIWQSKYGEGVQAELDEIEAIVADAADDLETTMNCVVHIKPVESARMGLQDHSFVVLAVIIGRTADKEVFNRAMQTIDHDIRDRIYTELD